MGNLNLLKMAEEGVEFSLAPADGSDPRKYPEGFTGEATASYTNGDKYIGSWKAGVRDGEGVFEYNSKGNNEETPVTYKGEWAAGKKCGIGKQIYRAQDGSEIGTYYGYSGNWREGSKDGKGTYVFEKTGQKYVGIFMQGQMIKGKWSYPNGTSFEGGFDNNKPKGQGCWSFENGNKVQGTYRQIHRVEDVANDIKISWTTAV